MAPADEHFISIIQSHPAIWNKKHPQHHNWCFLTKAWDKVAKECGEDKKTVENKWKCVKTRLQKELELIPVLKSGAAASNYSSKWNLFDKLKFVIDQMEANKATDNIINLADVEEYSSEDEEEHNQLQMNKIIQAKSISNKKVNNENELNMSPENQDLLFFKSLLPHITNMELIAKLEFKFEVASLVFKHAYDIKEKAPLQEAATRKQCIFLVLSLASCTLIVLLCSYFVQHY